jgi:hypothetical protein
VDSRREDFRFEVEEVPVESARLRREIRESSSSSPSLLLLFRFELDDSSDPLSLVPKMPFSISLLVRVNSLVVQRIMDVVLVSVFDRARRRS